MEDTYNGWRNWATWFAVSEMENDRDTYQCLQRLARTEADADEYRQLAQKLMFPTAQFAAYGEMSRAEFADVDWEEIRSTLSTDV